MSKKSDTQKTTKGVREAPAVSESVFKFPATLTVKASSEPMARAILGKIEKAELGLHPHPALWLSIDEPVHEPRYTVELTTEGWQIKDNEQGTIRADVYSDKLSAEVACEALEEEASWTAQTL